jgi:hypothetical protein
MRLAYFFPIFLSCTSLVWAQAPATARLAQPLLISAGGVEQRTERLHLEGSGPQIDELRLGGETKTIDVQPKGGLPAYQIQPTTGVRSWKILGF